MDQPETIDQILSRLTGDFMFYSFTLMPSPQQLAKQLQRDIDQGLRCPKDLERDLSRLSHYAAVFSEKIPTDGKTPEFLA